jgi:hypothetical protein
MNEKTAKFLRRQARRNMELIEQRTGTPSAPYVKHPTTGAITCHPHSFRGQIKALKHFMKARTKWQ